MIRILLVHNRLTRFVMLDRDLLARHHLVREWYQRGRKVNLPALWRAVGESDLVLGWFASWHTFWPALVAWRLGRSCIMVVGGYDTAALSDIGYGNQRGGLRQWVSRWVMKKAAVLVVNSDYIRKELGQTVGLWAQEMAHVIHHGIPDDFGALPPGPRKRLALTVGDVEKVNLLRKGHLPFVKAGMLLPEIEFELAGAWRDSTAKRLWAIAAPNVNLAGRVSEARLHDLYAKAAVYVQASAHEGFGLSVAEAMLAGCVPVVTRAGSLPEVAGEYGVYVEPQPEAVSEGIRAGIDKGDAVRALIRQRVLEEFPLKRREAGLNSVIEAIMDKKRGR